MQWIANPQNRQFESDSVLQFFKKSMLGSSIGLGHRPFTAGRGVRFPYRVPVLCGYSTVGSTSACQAEGHEFEPRYPLQDLKETAMPSVKYLHCSSEGSYYINCEIVEKIDENHFRIRYEDLVTDEVEEEVVSREYLEFPKFNEYMFC